MTIRLAFLIAVGAWLCTSPVLADDPKPAELNRLRLYVPTPQIRERFGDDVAPLGNYIKALEKRTAEIVSEAKPPEAKGLLIAVGIKSKTQSKVWCQAVDGQVPAELVQRLEKELSEVEAIDLKQSPAAFALEIKLFGKTPAKYPEFPDVFLEAAKKSETRLLIPPDDLFKAIWPE